MTKENYFPKHAGQDLRKALMLAKYAPEQQTELESLYARLDRLTAVQMVEVINVGLDGGLPLRSKPERAPTLIGDTPEDERERRERQRTF